MADKKIIHFNRLANKLLRKAYQLKYFPVGIKFIKKGEEFFNLPRVKEEKSVCVFIKIAAKGESFYLDRDRISCSGGLKWMGFSSKLTKTFLYYQFLGKIEKIKSSPKIAKKFIDSLPKPPKEGLYEKMLFAPLKNCLFEPDVVLIITNPQQAYRFIVTTYLNEYRLLKMIPLCATCHGAITIPFTTGEVNISLIDPIARELGRYKKEEILVGIPKLRFISLLNNLNKTPYGIQKEVFIAKIIKKFII